MTEAIQKTYFLLCSNRKQLRRLATIAYNAIVDLYKVSEDGEVKEGPSEDVFEQKFTIASDRFERLFQLDSQVSEVIFQVNLTDKEIDEDFDCTEAYRDKWHDLSQRRAKFSKAEIEASEVSFQCNTTKKKARSLKLFKLEPKKYDGSLQGWIGFWAMFKTIHEDEDLDVEEKFLYLLQLTKEGSPARELLEVFPPSAENYPKAIQTLTNRFGRTDMLVEYYVRELLKLVLIQATDSAKLSSRCLYDRLETQLRALESLGVVKDNFSVGLVPLVESSLPDHVLRLWERERSSGADQLDVGRCANMNGRLDELLKFLSREVQGEERFTRAKRTFSSKDIFEQSIPRTKADKKESEGNSSNKSKSDSTPTAAGLINVKSTPNDRVSCIFCSNTHPSESCLKAHDLSSEDIKEKLQQNGHCFLCFKKGHSRMKCKAFIKCVICGFKHNPLLCPDRKMKVGSKGSDPDKVDHNLSATNYSPILLQTLKVKLRGDSECFARVLIDCGSQRSYATRRIVNLVGYKPLRQETLVHALFGGSTSTPQLHQCFKIKLSSLSDNYHCNFDVLDTETICHAIPGPPQGPWISELKRKGVQLTDEGEGPVDVLIGADIAGKIWTGPRVVLSCGLVAMETVLGWTLMGKLAEPGSDYKASVAMFCADASACDLRRVDILGTEDPVEKSSRQQRDLAAKEHSLKTVRVLEDGRYEVQLPWVEDHAPLPINFDVATKRLKSTVRMLRCSGLMNDYRDVFYDWLREGIIEEVALDKRKAGHYLPHRPVIKERSTTRIRPVFDASCRAKGSPPLNQCLETGMNLIKQIPSILLRFRLDNIGIIADIKKAFLQLSVAPIDRDFLRFLWQEEDGGMRIFRHKRLVLGVLELVFLRIEWRGNVFIHLVGARSRVAPLKKTTIPRLELLAATLGARLTWNILKEHSVPKCYYWSDSSTVIAWIHRLEPWNIFVFNRVSEIRKLSDRSSWDHIPGIYNPADLLSRGCGPKQLAESSWWLRLSSGEWPARFPNCIDEDEVMEERKKSAVVALVQEPPVFCSAVLSHRFSKFYQIVRVVAWIIRFLFNKLSKRIKYSGPLLVRELLRAEMLLLKVIQDESFDAVKDRKLLKLKLQIDSMKLIRLHSKSWVQKDSEDFRATFILPPDHVLVESLIMDTHIRNEQDIPRYSEERSRRVSAPEEVKTSARDLPEKTNCEVKTSNWS